MINTNLLVEAARKWDSEHSLRPPTQRKSIGMVDSPKLSSVDQLSHQAKIESPDDFDNHPMEFQAFRALKQNAHSGLPLLLIEM